jgi:hypothetical protein
VTDYDPNYTPDEDPWDDAEVLGTSVNEIGNFFFYGCITIIGLGVVIFAFVAFGFACYGQDGFCR